MHRTFNLKKSNCTCPVLAAPFVTHKNVTGGERNLIFSFTDFFVKQKKGGRRREKKKKCEQTLIDQNYIIFACTCNIS